MKRRSRVPVDYTVPEAEEEDDDFVDGRRNREKNNNRASKKANKDKGDVSKSEECKDHREEEEEEEEHDLEDDCDGSQLLDDKQPLRPAVSVVKKGPKKLVLKKKKVPQDADRDEDEENRQGGEKVTLIRGVKKREFVLFKSDNFNFSVQRRDLGRSNDLLHHFSQKETDGPSRLPSALLVKPLLNRYATKKRYAVFQSKCDILW